MVGKKVCFCSLAILLAASVAFAAAPGVGGGTTDKPTVTPTQSIDMSVTSLGKAPVGLSVQPVEGMGGSPELPTDTAYGRDEGLAGDPLVSFILNAPGAFTNIGTTGIANFVNAYDFAGSNFGTLYMLDTTGGFYSVSTANGASTFLGNAVGVAGHSWTALAWNSVNNTMYATSTNITASNLYTINLANGAATSIGDMGSPGIISLAIDCLGQAYAHDIVNDNLVSVNLTTGATTPIGPLGFNANFGQGMDFDDSTGQLYMAAFNATSFQAELRIVNTGDGSSALVGALNIPGTTQLGSLAIAQACDFEPSFGACCDEPLGICQENISIFDCLGPGLRFLADGSCDDFDPPCGLATGACCYEDATCIQVPQQFCRNKTPGDMDCDGDVDFDDIDPFVLALGGPGVYYAEYPLCNWMNADTNGDGLVNFDDIDAFVALIGQPAVEYPATFLGAFTNCSSCPCVVLCPPGAYREQEPCGADTNGGCNMPTPTFEPIACGQTVCGTAWFDGSTRDTDWYQITLTEPATLTIELRAEFAALSGLIEQICYGQAGCDNITGSINPAIFPGECQNGSTTTICLQPGVYYIFVGPQFTNIEPCPADYVLRVTCEPCELPVGACCLFPSGECFDDVNEQTCNCQVGGIFQGNGSECANVVCPVPPANDECSGAEYLDLSGGPLFFTVDNTYATDDNTPSCGSNAGPPFKGIWYKVTGTGNSILITTCNPGTINFDTRIQVWCGCDLALCVGGNDDDGTCPFFSSPWTSTFQWCGAPGVDYYIIIGGYSSGNIGPIDVAIGEVDVCTPSPIEQCTIPPGDTCEDPIILSGPLPITVDGNSCGFGHQYNEVCPFTTPGSPDVVYRWSPDTTGVYTVTLCNDPTNYDSKLYIFENACVNPAIACNDDDCSTLSFPSAGVSEIEQVTLTAGNTYYIVVDGYASASCGNYRLVIREYVPCEVPCPPGGVAELEACGADTNGGCNMPTPAFEPIACGETKCGTAYYDGSTRDTDWYELVLTSPARLTVAASGEFDILTGVLVPPCPVSSFLVSATAAKCLVATTPQTECLPAGTYWIFVAPQFTTPVACPADYYVTVTCTPCVVSYCSATATNCSASANDEFIVRVQLNTLDNSSDPAQGGGGNGVCYSDFTSMSTDLQRGQSYTLTATNSTTSWASDRCQAWIDYDSSLVFDEVEKLGPTAGIPGVGPYVFNFTVPADAPLGATRLRVRLQYSGTTVLPCGNVGFGETEDYTVNIVP
ncbi:MAG: hypothetical protein IPM13_02615 [Phycisphaerales bacterium]|nr:hypothetical protein [Phycisphaerales bacterium]